MEFAGGSLAGKEASLASSTLSLPPDIAVGFPVAVMPIGRGFVTRFSFLRLEVGEGAGDDLRTMRPSKMGLGITILE